MRTLISILKRMIIALMLCFVSGLSIADNYQQAMGQALQSMTTANNTEKLLAVADQFERIGNAEKNQWLPFYYASFSCLNVIMRSNNLNEKEKEQIFIRAEGLLQKAKDVAPKESELYALQGLLYQLMISNPEDGATLSMKSASALEKAQSLNSENPRVYYIQGTNAFYTPKMFGGGAERAKPLFEKAKQLFDAQQVTNPFLPSWGKEHNEQLLNQCN
jgi:hypothetical protein